VNRDGRVNFPELGPIAVSGLRFEEAKARIETRVNEQMIGTTAVVSIRRPAIHPRVRGSARPSGPVPTR